MPRLRLFALALALHAGAALAIFVGPAPRAVAESTDPLFDLQSLGDPNNPQRLRRATAAAKSKRDTDAATSTFQPASGAGSTGFDSTNAKKRKTKGRHANAEKAKASAPPPFPTRYGSPTANPLRPTQLAIPRPATGVARKGASAYYVAPETDEPPPRRRPPPDETPFDPIGVRLGAFLFKPAIELTGGYDTNPSRTLLATPSLYWVVAPELKFTSNWSRHEFAGDLRGSYISYRELPSENRPNFDGKLTGRVDVTRDTRIDLETKLLIGTDNPGSPNIQAGLSRLPIFTTFGGSAGLGHRFNRLDLSFKGGAERTVYQRSTFIDGTTASNDDRNFNRTFTQSRASYELTPGFKPFVEGGVDRRVHDLQFDSFGFQRDSDGFFVKGGSTLELTRLITGEAAVGWLRRSYEDPRLAALQGLTIDGSLTWLPSALTTVKLTAATRADETTVPGVSGVFTREIALQVDHAFRRWLIATAKMLYGNDDYVGSERNDDRYSASVGITYKLNRDVHLKSELRRDWLRSSIPAADYTANVVLLGVRLQR